MIKTQKITRKKNIHCKKAMALFIFLFIFYFQCLNAQLYTKENSIISIQDSTIVFPISTIQYHNQIETIAIYIEEETPFSGWQYFKNTCKIEIVKQESLENKNKNTAFKNKKKSEKKNIIKKKQFFQKKFFITKSNPSILKLTKLTHHLACLNNIQQKLLIQIHNESSILKIKDTIQYIIIHYEKVLEHISVNSLSIRPPPILKKYKTKI